MRTKFLPPRPQANEKKRPSAGQDFFSGRAPKNKIIQFPTFLWLETMRDELSSSSYVDSAPWLHLHRYISLSFCIMKIFIMSDLGLRTGMSRLSALNFFVRKKWLSALKINSKSWPADGLVICPHLMDSWPVRT